MKINPINTFKLNLYQPAKTAGNSMQNTQNQQFDCNLSEVIGRSQVNFTSKKSNKIDDFTKEFITSTSIQLDLSDSDKLKFERTVNKYFKENNISSMGELIEKKDTKKLNSLIDVTSKALDLSGDQKDILVNKIRNYFILGEFYKLAQEDEAFADNFFAAIKNKLTAGAVSAKIVDKFNLNEKDEMFITLKLENANNENIKPEQTAFELIEKYNLSSEDYKFIVKTIKEFDDNDVLSISILIQALRDKNEN